MKRNDCFAPHFSLTPPNCRGAGLLPYMEQYLCCGNVKEQTIEQITVWPEQTCSYSHRWLLDGIMPTWISSLTSELQCMCSHCGRCSNRLSICNSEMGSGKINGQYFCIFTPNATQRAHQNRGSEILMLIFGSGVPSLLSCLLKFLLLDLLDGIFQHWTEKIARIPPRELQFSSSSFWDLICLNCIDPYLGWYSRVVTVAYNYYTVL